MFDGERPVAAHPHREGVETSEAERLVVADRAVDGGYVGEILRHASAVVGVGCHPHHAADVHGAELLELAEAEILEQLFGIEAELGLLAGHVDLHEYAADDAGALRLAVDELEEAFGVDALNHGDFAYKLTHLVGLQMADEMPAYVGGELRDLRQKFLHAALAETALPGVVGLLHSLRRMKLGNRHQADPGRQLLMKPFYLLADHLYLIRVIRLSELSELRRKPANCFR